MDLNRILRQQGCKLRRMVITVEDYQRLISSYLDEQVAKEKQRDMDAAVNVDADLEDLDLDGAALEEALEEEADLGAALQDAGAAPVIALVNKVLVKALQRRHVRYPHRAPRRVLAHSLPPRWCAAGSLSKAA
jgi:type IV pilus assembly protein PilB